MRALWPLLVAAAALRGAGAQHCPPGAVQSACAAVLVVHADTAAAQAADVRATLRGCLVNCVLHTLSVLI